MKARIVLLAALALCSLAAAQEGPVMVVTGAKVAEDIQDAVEAVEVISREEAAALGARTAADVLESIPGVVLFERAQSTVMMQGFDGAYVKVLVDGMEITGDEGGATPVSLLPVSDIERIEIVRGASSVLYGSDALGGVINIITKKPEGRGLSLRTRQEFSSNLRYYGEGFLGWDSPSVSLSLRGGFDWDGGRISPQRNLMGQAIDFYEVPANRMGNLRANAAWRHGGGDIEVFGFWNDSVLRSSSDLTSGYEYSNARLGGGLSHSWRLGDTALLDGFFTYTQLDYNAEKQDYTFATASADASNFFRDMEGELRFSWEPLISHALLFGVNAKREALESVDFDEEKSLIQVAAFVQDTWNVGARDRFRIVPGLRFDYRLPNSAEEEPVFKLTPKLSLRFDPAERLILRLSYGMGFKAPTLKQNYWVFWHPAPNNWLILGNPALRPETSHGFNAQADYAPWPGFTLSAAGYFNYIVDKIETLADENAGSALNSKTGALQAYTRRMVYSNVGKALTTGGDLSLRFAGERLSLSGVYSIGYAGAYDETEKKYLELPSMTAHQVNLNAAWRIPVLEATAALRLTWHTPRLLDVSDSNGRMRTPDYLMAHLRVSKLLFGERLEVYGAVQNLLNNTHFITGSGGSSQRDYYGLLDGVIFTLGGSLRR